MRQVHFADELAYGVGYGLLGMFLVFMAAGLAYGSGNRSLGDMCNPMYGLFGGAWLGFVKVHWDVMQKDDGQERFKQWQAAKDEENRVGRFKPRDR